MWLEIQKKKNIYIYYHSNNTLILSISVTIMPIATQNFYQ